MGVSVANVAGGGDARSGVCHENQGRHHSTGGCQAHRLQYVCKRGLHWGRRDVQSHRVVHDRHRRRGFSLMSLSSKPVNDVFTRIHWKGHSFLLTDTAHMLILCEHKLPGAPTVVTLPGWIRFGTVAASSYLTGKVLYYAALHMSAEFILKNDNGEDRMKMELANIILTKHSDDKLLVESVKRQFIPEHLFNDLHQDKPLFRWRPRHSYVDSAFMERLKEMEDEVNKSEDEERSISGETNVNMRSFGDIMHDPLACVLGSPGSSIESNSNPTEKGCTTLKKSRPRALRRSIQHRRHRHPNKSAAL